MENVLSIKDSLPRIREFAKTGRIISGVAVPVGVHVKLSYACGTLTACEPVGRPDIDLLRVASEIEGVSPEIPVHSASIYGYITVNRAELFTKPEIYGTDISKMGDKILGILMAGGSKPEFVYLADYINITSAVESHTLALRAVRGCFDSLTCVQFRLDGTNLETRYNQTLRKIFNVAASNNRLIQFIRIMTYGNTDNTETYYTLDALGEQRVLNVNHVALKVTKNGRITFRVSFEEWSSQQRKLISTPDISVLRGLGINRAGTKLNVTTMHDVVNIINVAERCEKGRELSYDLTNCPRCRTRLVERRERMYCTNRHCAGRLDTSVRYFFSQGLLNREYPIRVLDKLVETLSRAKEMPVVELFSPSIIHVDRPMFNYIQTLREDGIPLYKALLMLEIDDVDSVKAEVICNGRQALSHVFSNINSIRYEAARRSMTEFMGKIENVNAIAQLDKLLGYL